MPEQYNVTDLQERQITKYKMKRYKGAKLTLPTGMLVPGEQYVNVKPPGTDDHGAIADPKKYIKHPRPGCEYVWRARADDETVGLVEAHRIRPVKMDEIERNAHTAKLSGFSGPAGTVYVGWKRMALFEVPADVAYEWFQHPVDWAAAKTLNRGEEFREEVESFTQGKMTGTFERKDPRNAREELAESARS
jgi:hypothetical protein